MSPSDVSDGGHGTRFRAWSCTCPGSMSDKDDVQPFHAKNTAPGQEAADVVAEVLAHAKERETASKKRTAPKGPPKWMMPVTVNLGLLAMYFLFAQPQWIVVSPLDDPRGTEERVEASRQGIYFDGIQRIEQFQQSNGRLPASLIEAGSTLADQGVNYSVIDSTYLLTFTIEGESYTFDSATQTSADFVGGFINLPG